MSIQHLKNYQQESKQFKKRLIIATMILGILFTLLIVRLFKLQIINYRLYSDLALQNQLIRIPIEPNRGLIYDRNGILIADNIPIFNLEIAVKHIKNLSTLLPALKNIITITPEDIKRLRKAISQHQRVEYLPLKSKLTQEEIASFYVNQHYFPGIIVAPKMVRHYPLAGNTVNAVGYVGRLNKQELRNVTNNNYSENDVIGKVGIEKYYEEKLHGTTGHKAVEVDANGRIIRTVKVLPPVSGISMHLTIDSQLQKIAYDFLDKERGAVVAIDPNNGEILALVSTPNYNPNLFSLGIDNDTYARLQASNDKPMHNRATRGIFPFGSTIKPFVALQGLDTGVIKKDSTIFDPGWFKLENSSHIHRDWIHNGHGIVNITKAITQSCNTFFYHLATKLGIAKISDILTRFGFGQPVNIDITEESSGIVATPQWLAKYFGKRWYLGDTVVAGIGQGYMSTTPLQLACGTATLAMRGIRYQPHILLATQAPDGAKTFTQPVILPPVTLKNKDNWDTVINAMQDVIIAPVGTGYRRFGQYLKYTVAGKTGTVQLYNRKIVNENLSPEKDDNIPKYLRNHSLFIAFAPVDKPKIALAIIVENGKTAPQLARKMLDYYLLNALPKTITPPSDKHTPHR